MLLLLSLGLQKIIQPNHSTPFAEGRGKGWEPEVGEKKKKGGNNWGGQGNRFREGFRSTHHVRM